VAVDRLDVLMHYIRGLVGSPRDKEADAALLASYVREQDDQAFAVLMRRYGSLVWRVSLRAAGHEQDAEDIFQATFLLLARKARTIRKKDSLGSWLFGVARRLALRQKTAAARRRKREERAARDAKADTSGDLSWREIRAVLDEELGRLPEMYRAPLLLCYYENLTQEEAANRLGWSSRAVKDRLERGRDLLCRRLSRRGLTLSAALTGTMLTANASTAAVPATLAAVTFRAAISYSLGQPVVGAASAQAVALANSALKALFLTKVLIVTAAAMAVLGIGGAGLVKGLHITKVTSDASAVQAEAPAEPLQQPRLRLEKARVDLHGDPLPPGAIARLGTVRFRPGESPVSGLGVLADNKTLVSAKAGNTVQFWDTATGTLLRELSTGALAIRSFTVAADGNHFAIGGVLPHDENTPAPGAIGLWDATSDRQAQLFQVPSEVVLGGSMALSADGKVLATLSHDGVLQIQDVATGTRLLQHQFEVSIPDQIGLALSPDGSTIALVHGPRPRNKLCVWKWQTEGEPQELQRIGRAGFGNVLAISPNGKTLVEISVSLKEEIRVWSVATGRLLHQLQHPNDNSLRSNDAMFSRDGKTLLVASAGKTGPSVQMWDTAAWKHRIDLDQGAKAMAVSPDSRLIAGIDGAALHVWDMVSGKELANKDDAHTSSVLQITAAGNVVATRDSRTIRLWDGVTGQHRFKLTHDGSLITALALSPDGAKLLSSGLDKSIKLWDTASREPVFEVATGSNIGPAPYAAALGFLADGKQFVSFEGDWCLRQREVATGLVRLERRIPPDKPPFGFGNSFAFSPDGGVFTRIPEFGRERSIQGFNSLTGQELFQVLTDSDAPHALAISSGGKFLLASTSGKYAGKVFFPISLNRGSFAKGYFICLWDLSTHQLVRKIAFNEGGPAPVALSQDGQFFAAAAGQPDRRIRIWKTANGQEVGTFQGFDGTVVSLAFETDGNRLISGMDDSTALVWGLK
jgi:RNA polymerase sigma factor (sigma-70 family)